MVRIGLNEYPLMISAADANLAVIERSVRTNVVLQLVPRSRIEQSIEWLLANSYIYMADQGVYKCI